MVERLTCNQDVVGSSPAVGSLCVIIMDDMSFLVVANWKANGNARLAESFLDVLSSQNSLSGGSTCSVVLCPPYTAMPSLRGRSCVVRLGGQDCFAGVSRGCTGEITAKMLRECGCEYVILGHSDRRTLLNESDSLIKLKAESAVGECLIPIICVGENREERESGATGRVLLEQCRSCLPEEGEFFVAYEPIWAIGGSVIPDIAMIEEAFSIIKSHNPGLRIIYGGSVNESNIRSLKTGVSGIAGVLVGSASLDADGFARMLDNVMECL